MRHACCCALFLIGSMVLAIPASAVSVQRCLNEDGGVEYRDAPCDPGATMEVIDLQPNTVREIDQRAALAAEAALSMRLAMRMQAQAFERQYAPAGYVEPMTSDVEPDSAYYSAWGYGVPRRPDKHRRSSVKPDHHAKRVVNEKTLRPH